MAEKFEGRVYNDFGMVHIDDVKNTFVDIEYHLVNMKNHLKIGIPVGIDRYDPKFRFY